MGAFHYFILSTILFVMIVSCFLSFKISPLRNEKQLMMIPMSLGMNLGITAGILFGALLSDSLYQSTLVSMFVGIAAGAVCGAGMGIMGLIEGSTSGLMGSMMGAMLGAMITHSQSVVLVEIFITFSISSLLLFFILPEKTKNNSTIKSTKWFIKPLLTILIVSSYLLLGSKISHEKTVIMIHKMQPTSESQQHSSSHPKSSH